LLCKAPQSRAAEERDLRSWHCSPAPAVAKDAITSLRGTWAVAVSCSRFNDRVINERTTDGASPEYRCGSK
jgi:hypothetical protein